MKYIITEKGTVVMGNNTFHSVLSEEVRGERIVAAGHARYENGAWKVFGESIGYGIEAQPEDAEVINKAMANETVIILKQKEY